MKTEKIIADRSGRLDKVLAAKLSESRNQIEKLIRVEQVAVNGEVTAKPSRRVESGDAISYTILEVSKKEEIPIDFDVKILYEDEDILVVNKPSGLVVHPAPSVKEPTLVDWLIHKGISLSTISGEERHGIVHRIDKETTGALVVAKNNIAHKKLSEQLQNKSMGRYYLAIVDQPLKTSRVVEAPIARNPKNRLKMGIVEGGRDAKTKFVQLSVSPKGISLVSAKLFTGRTHQVRVHLGLLGRHILGDNLYGFKSKEGKITRTYLHAYILYLVHPVSGDSIEVVAPMFDDMTSYLEKNFDKEILNEAIRPENIRHRFLDDVFV